MEQIVLTKAQVSVSDAGEVEGIAWIFDEPDSTGDIILPGAITFAKSVPMVLEHNESVVVGVWSSHSENARQMNVKGNLFVDGIAPARKAREQLKAKKLSGLSFKFTSDQYEPNAHGGTTFKAVTVTEISLCRLPVHPGARITAVKAKPAEGKVMEENQDTKTEAEQIVGLEERLKAFETTVGAVDKLVERVKAVETKANRPGGEEDKKQEVTEQRKAFGTYLRLGYNTPVEQLKALTVSSDPGGGYFAPEEMSNEFIRDLVLVSPVRSVASVRSTAAPSVSYPKRTGITNAKWKGELQPQESSEPAFGQAEIPVKEINTYVDISNQLLADSAGQAEAEVRLALADDFGQKEGVAFVKGDGALAPQGLMTNSDIGYVPSTDAAKLTADGFVNLMYDLPPAYRNAGTWAMNSTTLGRVRLIKDGDGRFLWQPSFQLGQPETILGRPVIEMPDMDDVAANAFPIIFGDFSGYRIIDRIGLQILVNPYLKATEGITRIHATRRVGAGVLQAAKFKKMKISVN
jgi:HK97 family phage major capsid protein/HK97 family phage prohead protease